MARWEEREYDLEGDWAWNFEGFEDLGVCEVIVIEFFVEESQKWCCKEDKD